jgi:Zn-dependent peptidase ImmA (M78 family)
MKDMRRKGITYLVGDEIRPTNLRKAQVEDYARKVAAKLAFDVANDPKDLVTLLDGTIHFQSLDDMMEESGSIFVHAPNDFDILLAQYTSPIRDRFTLAHEIGHYFLHSNQGDIPIVATRRGSTRIEWEANWFAAELLMPKSEFTRVHKQLQDWPAIAYHFKVSVDAVKVRGSSLGIAS